MINDQTTLEHLHIHGWMRVIAAFSNSEAAAMRDAVWRVLAGQGISRDNRSTWKTERPAHLQSLKEDPVFNAVGSARVLAAIEAVLAGQPHENFRNWGAHFIAFPCGHEWNIPSGGWHTDANYLSGLSPPDGIRTHALLGDVEPRGGGTLFISGSHRLVHKWFKENPPPSGSRSGDMRRLLLAHPYIRDLHTEGTAAERIERFMQRVEEVGGIPLQVIENIGTAGDVILAHPLLLHVATANTRTEPRFLMSGGIDTVGMYAKPE